MKIQIVQIFHPSVFNRYKIKYKLSPQFLKSDQLGIEIRGLSYDVLNQLINAVSAHELDYFDYNRKNENLSDILLLGSLSKLQQVANDLNSHDYKFGDRIHNTMNNYCGYKSKSITIGGNEFPLNHYYIMGILNITPDSFSDGGKFYSAQAAIDYALEMIEEGADIIDIGGESSRPGSEEVSEEEEIRRVIPVIEEVMKLKPDSVISIDTTKSRVAEHALSVGAKIINDISGLTFDDKMIGVAIQFNAAVVLMHMKGTPRTMQINPFYEDVAVEVYDFLASQVEFCETYGLKNIIIDPGIGFGKQVEDNYELINRLQEFNGLGYPVLVGVSRKSFIGKSLHLDIENRDTATALIESRAVCNGASFIRTHNVKNAIEARKIIQFIENQESPVNV